MDMTCVDNKTQSGQGIYFKLQRKALSYQIIGITHGSLEQYDISEKPYSIIDGSNSNTEPSKLKQ